MDERRRRTTWNPPEYNRIQEKHCHEFSKEVLAKARVGLPVRISTYHRIRRIFEAERLGHLIPPQPWERRIQEEQAAYAERLGFRAGRAR